MRRRLLALLFSVPLAAAGFAGVALHVCHSMGGAVVGDCDCEKQAHHVRHASHSKCAAHDAPVTLETGPCCVVERSNLSQLVATQEICCPQIDEAAVALVGARDSRLIAARPLCHEGPNRERGPPNAHGPPIFIRNCSLLN